MAEAPLMVNCPWVNKASICALFTEAESMDTKSLISATKWLDAAFRLAIKRKRQDNPKPLNPSKKIQRELDALSEFEVTFECDAQELRRKRQKMVPTEADPHENCDFMLWTCHELASRTNEELVTILINQFADHGYNLDIADSYTRVELSSSILLAQTKAQTK